MIESADVTCPYCWETIELSVDLSAGSQTYIEDCAVCCRPMTICVEVADGGEDFSVQARSEDE
jgi:hypothetical protein